MKRDTNASTSAAGDGRVVNNMNMRAVNKKERYLKRCLAQTMQWIGSDGVLRIVQPG